jgi:hypothetical protein
MLEDLIRFSGEDGDRLELLKSFEIIKLLLRFSADFEQQCGTRKFENGDSGGLEITIAASELLRKWYNGDQFAVLEDIVKRRDRKGKKKHGITKKLGHLKLWVASKK